MKYVILLILVTQIIIVECFGGDMGENAAREVSNGMREASRTISYGIEEASKTMKDGMTETSKTMKDGMEQIRYFGYATVDLLLSNPWVRLLIIIECCYAAFKTLQIAEQLKFNWRSVLPIAIVIVGLTIVWPPFRVIAILIAALTTAILLIYRRSFSYSSLLQRLFS